MRQLDWERTQILEALDEAVMCWELKSKGVFQSSQVDDIGDRLIETLERGQCGIEIDKLVKFILREVDDEPSESESAVDAAIRIIRELLNEKEGSDKMPITIFPGESDRVAFAGSDLFIECQHCQDGTIRLTANNPDGVIYQTSPYLKSGLMGLPEEPAEDSVSEETPTTDQGKPDDTESDENSTPSDAASESSDNS